LCFNFYYRVDSGNSDKEGDGDEVMEDPFACGKSSSYPESISLTKALNTFGFKALATMLTSYITIHRVLPFDTPTRLWSAAKSFLKDTMDAMPQQLRKASLKLCYEKFCQCNPTLDNLRTLAKSNIR
jgi:hypothetical protein